MPPGPNEPAGGTPSILRVIVPVTDIDRASRFYATLLGLPGVRVTSGRHRFPCGGTTLACFDPRADAADFELGPTTDHLCFAVEDLEELYWRPTEPKAEILSPIEVPPWRERSFYLKDPFGNKLCFVDRTTVFLGKEPFIMPT